MVAAPSIGTIGDSFDDALAETTIGLFKTGLHRKPAALAANGGPRRGLDDVGVATSGWVSWFNEERPHGELDDRSWLTSKPRTTVTSLSPLWRERTQPIKPLLNPGPFSRCCTGCADLRGGSGL